MVRTKQISISTKGKNEILNITEQVAKVIEDSGVNSGIVCIFLPGATGALTTIEYEEGLLRDYRRFWDKIAPQDMDYAHDLRWHDKNGHSHVRASLQGASLTIPFTDKKLLLGTWQQIVLLDFDVRSRERDVILQILGE